MELVVKPIDKLSPSEREACARLTIQEQIHGGSAMRVHLENLAGNERWHNIRAVLARDDGDVVGWATVAEYKKNGLISCHVFVDPSYRGRGLGVLLAKRAVREAGNKIITVQARDSAGAKMYRKAGFEIWHDVVRDDVPATPMILDRRSSSQHGRYR